jgi:hypothetical protein
VLRATVRDEVRQVVREEIQSALAAYEQCRREREVDRLIPLAEAARRSGVTPKALRSRCERGSIAAATKIGGRWHLPLAALNRGSSLDRL